MRFIRCCFIFLDDVRVYGVRRVFIRALHGPSFMTSKASFPIYFIFIFKKKKNISRTIFLLKINRKILEFPATCLFKRTKIVIPLSLSHGRSYTGALTQALLHRRSHIGAQFFLFEFHPWSALAGCVYAYY